MSDKMLDRVGKLLTQAENASTPEEAAAFMEKAQRLAEANSVDLALARYRQLDKTKAQQPEERRIQVNPYTRKINRKHFLELAMAIANVNDIEYLIGGKEYTLHAVGFPSDLDVLEALYTHLSVQMALECDAAIARGDNKKLKRVPKQRRVELAEDERDWGGSPPAGDIEYNWEPGYPRSEAYDPPKFKMVPVTDEYDQVVYEERLVAVSDARAFRGDFYASFVARMRARLWDAKRAAQKEAGATDVTSERGLALRDKREVVSKAHEAQRAAVHHLGTYKGSYADDRVGDYTGAGSRAGRRAAESVPVGTAREVE